MLFNRILEDAKLAFFVRDACEENGICATIDERIKKEHFLIIKPDDFYNSLNIEKRPPSPDCLILVKCEKDIEQFCLTIVELKNTKEYDIQNIIEKFRTCFDDFMTKQFKDFFYRDYENIKLYFVSPTEIYKRDGGLKMKILMNKKLVFRGKSYMIMPQMPNPAVKPCYC